MTTSSHPADPPTGERTRWDARWLWLIVVAAAIAIGVKAARSQGVGGDLHVYWHAGAEFAAGAPLYDVEAGQRAFLYPPFAAFVFQPLSWCPLPLAAGLCAAANVFLWVLAVVLTRRVCRACDASTSLTTWSTVAAVALSARYFRSNTTLVQVNALVLCLVLGGVLAFLSDRKSRSAALLCAAAWLKVTPVFVVLWVVLRGGRRMTARVAVFGSLFLALPFLQRGPTQGAEDLMAFKTQLASGVLAVSEESPFAAQNLRTAASAILGSPATADRWADLAALALVGLFVVVIWRRARHSLPISALELTLPILVAHLLPGKTQKHHLVTFLFVFQTLFSVQRVGLERWRRVMLYGAWGLAAFAALGGRSLVGRDLHAWLGDVSFLAWCMLYWTLTAVLLMAPDRSRPAASHD